MWNFCCPAAAVPFSGHLLGKELFLLNWRDEIARGGLPGIVWLNQGLPNLSDSA